MDLPVVYTARAEGIEEEWVGSGKDLDRCLGTDHCSVSSLFRGTVTQRTAGLRWNQSRSPVLRTGPAEWGIRNSSDSGGMWQHRVLLRNSRYQSSAQWIPPAVPHTIRVGSHTCHNWLENWKWLAFKASAPKPKSADTDHPSAWPPGEPTTNFQHRTSGMSPPWTSLPWATACHRNKSSSLRCSWQLWGKKWREEGIDKTQGSCADGEDLDAHS